MSMDKLLSSADCIIITLPSNLFYFTDYSNADAVLVFHKNKRYYFTDSRYFEEAESIHKTEVRDILQLERFIYDNRDCVFGIEREIPLDTYKRFKKYGLTRYNTIDDEIERMRAVKTPQELDRIINAQKVTDSVFEQVLSKIVEGMTERTLASIIEGLIFQCGGDGIAFDTIVAFGENTSKPHAHRSDKMLKRGELITMDFGAKYMGYCSDMTRTIGFGEISKSVQEKYNQVLSAQQIALEHIRGGKTGVECDAYARDYFRSLDVDKFFTHSLGHSLGIDVHESPVFSPKCNDIITEGMVLSVEPGLYFPSEFGIRIEDIIYIDKNGIQNLTKSPKELIILG